MNDIIMPSGFDLTKNLHGHVRVETRSRWTGKVIDSQEKENLVTNAVAKIYKAARLEGKSMWGWLTPIYAKALGGLLLFDNTLTESADNIKFPGVSKLVGFAGQDADTTHAMAGSYNASESTVLSNGFTTVWDFLTSQANGTISALARTSYYFAKAGISGAENPSPFYTSNLGPYTWGSPLQVLGYDATNKLIYLALSSQQTYNGVTYPTNKIYKTHCDFETQPLLNMYLVSNPDKWTEVTTVSSSTDGTNNAYQFTYDPYSDNFYYGVSTTTRKIYIISTSGTRSSITVPANISSYYALVATENYYWYIGSSSTIYQIKKSNPSDSNSVVPSFSPSRIVALADDCVWIGGSNSSYQRALIYADLTVLVVELSANITAYEILTPTNSSNNGRPPMLLGDYFGVCHANQSGTAAQPFPITSYLGTIANLDSPVTKTSSQTMKITYTLTEA